MSEPSPMGPQAPLRRFAPSRDFFVGVDSDGCVFDTMEVKHKECFIPNIIKCYDLAAIAKYVRETAEFVNLYSRHRGVNRFPGLVLTIDILAERPEVARRGPRLPDLASLRRWVERETRLSGPALAAEAEATGDPELVRALRWSEAVNRSIGELVKNVPPFPFVRETLEALGERADVMVVSATPGEALAREWEEHDLARRARLIAGQEMGSKREHIALAAVGRYAPDKILMVGDAPGDQRAAAANGALFYPIVPGAEEASWRELHEEALPRFFSGAYAGDYMREHIKRFEQALPERPVWRFV